MLKLFFFFISISFSQTTVRSNFEGMPDNRSYQIQEFRTEFHNILVSLSRGGVLSDIEYWKKNIHAAGLAKELAGELKEMEKLMPLARKTAMGELLRFSSKHPDFADLKSLERAWEASKAVKSYQAPFLKAEIDSLKKNRPAIAERQKKICGADKDLSAGFPKIRDQTNIGWCYAFAAADLASYHIGAKVSAADIATQFSVLNPVLDFTSEKDKLNPKAFHQTGLEEGGYVEDALKIIVQNGVCLEKDFPSEALHSKNQNKSARLKYIYEEIEVFQQVSEKFPSIADPYCQDIYDRVGKSMFPNVLSEDFKKIFLESRNKSLIARLGEKTCKGKRHQALRNYEVIKKNLNYEDPYSSAKYIMHQLDAGRPMGVSLNSSVVREPYVYSGERETGHAVIISGKRWNPKNQSCELKIRNSWGEANGDQWIPMGVIVPATWSVETLREKTQI